MKNKTTLVIKTIGRPTLHNAIFSAKREGFEPLIISDGVELSNIRHSKLGKRWGFYGGMVTNFAAALAETEFITLLDDDDELIEGAGDIINDKLNSFNEPDIWIGGVRFKDKITVQYPDKTIYTGTDLCIDKSKGVVPGNVAMPTYRTSLFSKFPIRDNVPKEHSNYSDFFHIKECYEGGAKVDWFGSVIYLVRPNIDGNNGEGV